MQTFEIALERKKIQRSNGNVVTGCFVRDLFGSILRLSLEEKIDMAEVLSYPLATVPLSLSYSNERKYVKLTKIKLNEILRNFCSLRNARSG